MTTTTNNATIAKELTEALGNTLAFGDHLERVAKRVALDLDGYSDAEAEEIRKLVFFDELPSESPAYAEGYNVDQDTLERTDIADADGHEKHRVLAEEITHESLGYGSVSNAHVIAEHLQGFVGTLACWKSGFDSEKYERHVAKAAKVRRYQSISEDIFDSAGRVKSLDGDKKPRRKRVARAATRNAKTIKLSDKLINAVYDCAFYGEEYSDKNHSVKFVRGSVHIYKADKKIAEIDCAKIKSQPADDDSMPTSEKRGRLAQAIKAC